MACNEKRAFFTSDQTKRFKLWSCQKVCDGSHYLLTIYFYDLALNCIDTLWVFLWVLIVLFLLQICFYFVMRETLLSLSENNPADIVEAFNSTSKYLDDLLNI